MNKGYIYQDIRYYEARGPEAQAIIKNRKKELNPLYKAKLDLDAFGVKSGSGTTNSGNTSRLALAQPEKLAEIVMLPVDLVQDMATMLDALNCGYELSPEKWQEMADSWLDRFHESDMSWNILSPYVCIISFFIFYSFRFSWMDQVDKHLKALTTDK